MNGDDVVAVTRRRRPREFLNLIGAANNPIGKEKAGSELFIVTRRAHRRRHRFAADPDLERFFHGELVAFELKRAVARSPDDLAGSDSVFFHRFDANGIIWRGGNLSSLHLAGT